MAMATAMRLSMTRSSSPPGRGSSHYYYFHVFVVATVISIVSLIYTVSTRFFVDGGDIDNRSLLMSTSMSTMTLKFIEPDVVETTTITSPLSATGTKIGEGMLINPHDYNDMDKEDRQKHQEERMVFVQSTVGCLKHSPIYMDLDLDLEKTKVKNTAGRSSSLSSTFSSSSNNNNNNNNKTNATNSRNATTRKKKTNIIKKLGSDPDKTVVLAEDPTVCGQLRRQWLHNPPTSRLAKSFEQHQSNCTLPLARHTLDNTFGLGSHFSLWGQALCNAMEDGYRMTEQLSHVDDLWIWQDQGHCNNDHNPNNKDDQNPFQSQQEERMSSPPSSPMECYLPVTRRNKCPISSSQQHDTLMVNVTDPRKQRQWCTLTRMLVNDMTQKALVRAAFTEYLFSEISPLVVKEAQRQIGIVFQDVGSKVPDDLVTVHVRWGDKFWEMDLPSIDEYIQGVARVLTGSNETIPPTANIFLATEDPKAYKAFVDAKPPGWNVFADITLQEIDAFRPPKGNRASWATRNTQGRAGLIAMGSLLVSLEAKYFVLTTKSNWSTIMNHLRTNIVDPRCNNCTVMVDLRPGVW